jgi:hypothetical protein
MKPASRVPALADFALLVTGTSPTASLPHNGVLFQGRLTGFHFGGRPEPQSRCFDVAGCSGSTAYP